VVTGREVLEVGRAHGSQERGRAFVVHRVQHKSDIQATELGFGMFGDVSDQSRHVFELLPNPARGTPRAVIPALWPAGSYSAQSGRIGSWRRSNAVALDASRRPACASWP
jgi:hypothetical protein